MASVPQRSFAAGELAPALAGRADQVKYATGLRTARNFVITKGGSAANRPGSQFLCEVKDSDDLARLIRFQFNDTDTYAIEAGNAYFRFLRNDAPLMVPDISVAPAWSATTTYIEGDVVADSGARYYCRRESLNEDPSANSGTFGKPWSIAAYGNVDFEVGDLASSAGDTYVCILNLPAFGMGVGVAPSADTDHWRLLLTGVVGGILEVVTPYADTDLRALQYVQSGDVITMVHHLYPQRELRRRAPFLWDFDAIDFAPSIDPPTNIGVAGSAGSETVEYAVTAVSTDNASESNPGNAGSSGGGGSSVSEIVTSVGGVSGLVVFTVSSGHDFDVGDDLAIEHFATQNYYAHASLASLNNKTKRVSAVTGTTLTLAGVFTDSFSTVSYTGVGRLTKTIAIATGIDLPSDSTPVTITWDAVDDAYAYNVYRRKNGVYGFIGTASGLTFLDDGIVPDTSITPPIARALFATDGEYPATVAYSQQRLGYANSLNAPEKVWLSRIGDYHNFSPRFILQADDSFAFTPQGEKVNAVQHLVEVGGQLAVLTAGAEWSVGTGSSGILSPDTYSLRQSGAIGSDSLRPLVFDATAIYVTARGGGVRALSYDLTSDGYKGADLSIYASHLFEDRTVVAWDYARLPHSVVWAVTDDGALLGMTYVPEHEIDGWHRHDTDGDTFEDVIVLPDGGTDALYVIVNRTVDGNAVRYIEKIGKRIIDDVRDSFFVDCGLTFDGRNDTAKTLTISGGTTWASTELLTLTASAAQFIAGDVGNDYQLTIGDLTVRCRVVTYTSATVVAVHPHRDLTAITGEPSYVGFRNTATATWARAVDDISGLDHLEGRTVAILADGNVELQQVVDNGAITLSRPAAVVHVGLPIEADLETLDLEDPQGETLAGKKKLMVQATALIKSSRGVRAGPDADHLRELRHREPEDWNEPEQLETAVVSLNLNSTWDNNGRLFIRQSDPLPIEVLAVVRTGTLGGRT